MLRRSEGAFQIENPLIDLFPARSLRLKHPALCYWEPHGPGQLRAGVSLGSFPFPERWEVGWTLP